MKKQINRIVIIMLLMVTIISLLTNISKAVDYTCKISLTSDKNKVKKGEAITILVKATEIKAGEGIILYNTVLEYNENVFDCRVSGDDEGNWGIQGGILENTLTMARNDLLPSSQDQTIAKIELTVKSNAPVGTQTIKLKQIELTSEEGAFLIDDVQGTISIIEESENNANTNNTNTNTNTSTNTNTNTNTNNTNTGNNTTGNVIMNNDNDKNNTKVPDNNNNNINNKRINTANKQDATIANKVIPKAGITGILIISIIIGIIMAIVAYRKYKGTC